MLTPKQEVRFWSYVERTDDCWLWRGGISSTGYGNFGVRVSPTRVQNHAVHRLAFALLRYPIPRGSVVMHSCDVRTCVNPAHLALGTQAANVADRDVKGRTARGDRNGNSTLTWDRVRAIRAALRAGATPTTLARCYGVHRDTIYLIRAHLTWQEKES